MRQRAKARRSTGPDSGAGLVEFALILPLLMALLLGIFTGGLAYNRKIAVTNAVREGARFGATLACTSSCSAVTYPNAAAWETQVRKRIVDSSGGELQLADTCAWIGTATGTSACGLGDPAGAAGSMVIKVSASKGATLEVVFFKRTVTLTSRSVARYERSSTYGAS